MSIFIKNKCFLYNLKLSGVLEKLSGLIIGQFTEYDRGFFYNLVKTSQQVGERPTAAFPSSHVGAGTFKPVKSEEIEGHEMHIEYISVS
ncbi:hypothetical protein D0T60_18910, partial [Bacteroides sp. 224]|nr:hypothetical protein [Bacteroides sp. 224]